MAVDWDGLLLAPLMSADFFGENVQPTYTPKGGGQPFPVDAVFDDGFKSVNPLGDGGQDISTSAPVMGVRLAQFPAGVTPRQGDQVYVPSKAQTYLVRNARPDGKGWVLLEFNEAA